MSKKSTLSWTEVPLAENRNRFSDCTPLPPVPPTPLENRIKWRFSPTRCFSAAQANGKTKCVAHATLIMKHRFFDRLNPADLTAGFSFHITALVVQEQGICRESHLIYCETYYIILYYNHLFTYAFYLPKVESLCAHYGQE